MTIEEILVFDNINNNNAQYTVEELIDSFNSYVKNGKVYRVNNTIIFVKQVLIGVILRILNLGIICIYYIYRLSILYVIRYFINYRY